MKFKPSWFLVVAFILFIVFGLLNTLNRGETVERIEQAQREQLRDNTRAFVNLVDDWFEGTFPSVQISKKEYARDTPYGVEIEKEGLTYLVIIKKDDEILFSEASEYEFEIDLQVFEQMLINERHLVFGIKIADDFYCSDLPEYRFEDCVVIVNLSTGIWHFDLQNSSLELLYGLSYTEENL